MRGTRRLLILLLWPGALTAQALGTVTGTVTAPDGTPLAFARVTVVGTAIVTFTRQDGGFRVAGVPSGARAVDIRMIGYHAVALPVEVEAGVTSNLQVTLALAPVPLEGVEVRAEHPRMTAMLGFEQRRAEGYGHFFNRQEIARMQPRLFTDILRRVPGVQIVPTPGPFESGEMVRMGRTTGVMGARVCPVLFYMNGTPFPVTGDIAINHFIAPHEVAGVEVYSGTARIPPQFQSAMHNARCGVIVIWTIDSVDSTESP